MEYVPIIVYEAHIDWAKYLETGEIPIHLENNKMPFDLFYFDQHGDIKFTIYMDEGKIQLFDTSFVTLYVGGERKEKNAFRRILKMNPDLIFKWDVIPSAYLFIKDNEAFIYDVFNGKRYGLKEYLHLNAESIQKELEYLEDLKSGIIH